jgi:hypothetical protein
MARKISDAHRYPEIGVPMFWPFGLALDLTRRDRDYLDEIEKTQVERTPPEWTQRPFDPRSAWL